MTELPSQLAVQSKQVVREIGRKQRASSGHLIDGPMKTQIQANVYPRLRVVQYHSQTVQESIIIWSKIVANMVQNPGLEMGRLGALWALLGASWARLGPSCARLGMRPGCVWWRLGGVLKSPSPSLKAS